MVDGEMLVGAPTTIGMLYWGRKVLDLPTRLPTWDRWLTRLWPLAVVLVALGLLVGGPVLNWLDDLFVTGMLGVGIAICWRLRAYRPVVWVGLGLLPFAVYMVLGLIVTLQTGSRNEPDWLGNMSGLALLWLMSFWLVARSQHKTLAAEQQRRLAAEQEQLAIETQNSTLEYEISQRTAALVHQTDELRLTLQELQATQDQLVQREKMASLGELTAGIAHEIQNPLNFVNNFADVSAELVAELEEERARPTRDYNLEAELLADLRQNLQRIAQHGGRASGIVRGMLAHSRAGSGERQPTDVNALCDEYLRLAYHGLRAKDKAFNATLATDLAADLPRVAAVPGDLGRVLLNLLTNAFYAVQQRQQQGADPAYRPTVRVSTSCADGQVCVQVQDNGTGIAPEVRQQLFQPFFTTKPSGEGTGLGLSLSYDIVTKGHGGTLDVASQVGEGTTFSVRLPC